MRGKEGNDRMNEWSSPQAQQRLSLRAEPQPYVLRSPLSSLSPPSSNAGPLINTVIVIAYSLLLAIVLLWLIQHSRDARPNYYPLSHKKRHAFLFLRLAPHAYQLMLIVASSLACLVAGLGWTRLNNYSWRFVGGCCFCCYFGCPIRELVPDSLLGLPVTHKSHLHCRMYHVHTQFGRLAWTRSTQGPLPLGWEGGKWL